MPVDRLSTGLQGLEVLVPRVAQGGSPGLAFFSGFFFPFPKAGGVWVSIYLSPPPPPHLPPPSPASLRGPPRRCWGWPLLPWHPFRCPPLMFWHLWMPPIPL